MLRTKSILVPREESEGLRISVMSRHTLNDGIIPHPLINSSSYDLWLTILAPPPKLLGDYYKRGLKWEQFERRYIEYLKQPTVEMEVRTLAQRSLDFVVTILCIEDNPERCHRRLLAEECKRYYPKLNLDLK